MWSFLFVYNCIFYFSSACFIDTHSEPIPTSESWVGGLQRSTERTCFQVTEYHMSPFSDTHAYALTATSQAVNEACVGETVFLMHLPLLPLLPLLLQCVFISYFKAMFSQEMLDYIYKLELERADRERLLKR